MTGIILLASYPKSGNTWLRAMISSLRHEGETIDINRLEIPNAADRVACDNFLGLHSADLNFDELAWARPKLYEFAARDDGWCKILKVHDACLPPKRNTPPPFSSKGVGAALYIVRDPRDVAVSFSHHLGISIDKTIEVMARPGYTLAPQLRALNAQLPQLLSTWSAHVLSWLNCTSFPVHLMRYEDMLADPMSIFGDAFRFIGLNAPRALMQRALAVTSFQSLKGQEETNGFKECPPRNDRFFRRGIANGWQDTLTQRQADQVVSDHSNVMQLLGYLSKRVSYKIQNCAQQDFPAS